MSAAAFAKGLLDLEGELTPILVIESITQYSIWGYNCTLSIQQYKLQRGHEASSVQRSLRHY
jgi:hypothetical protein